MLSGEIIRIAHLILLSIWGGIVVTEGVLELLPFLKKDLLKPTVIFHYYIDILLELPVIILVIATGIINLFFVPLTTLQLIKVGAAAVAITANLYCIVLVISRYRDLRTGAINKILIEKHQKIIKCAAIGLPFAAAAAILGFYIAMRLLQRVAV